MFDLLPFKRQGDLPSLFSEMDEMIKKMWFGFPFHNLGRDMDMDWSPRIDVSETDNALEIVADLPGSSTLAGSVAYRYPLCLLFRRLSFHRLPAADSLRLAVWQTGVAT